MIKRIFKNNLWLIILLIVSFFPLWDFFHQGIPLSHDIELHLARIGSFYESLTEGNVVPRWAGNLNWGYGTPILSFVYPLPSYFASLLLLLGFSLIDSTKIIFIAVFILSGVFMYLWIKELWSRKAGFISGILYLFAPYRFVDLYVRGALGESVAFMFLPMVLYFAVRKKFLWFSFSLTGLILSHNMLALIFLIPILGYLSYLGSLGKNLKEKILNTKYYILSTICGFLLSAFFWLPAIFEAKYTLRDVVTKNSLTGFEPLSRILWSSWNYGGSGSFSVQLGILQWLMMLSAPLIIWQFFKRKKKIWLWLVFLFLVFWSAIFLILPVSKILYSLIPFIGNFQFAWRFLSLAIFPAAVFGAALIYLLPKKFKVFSVLCLVLCVLWLNKDYWHAQSFLQKPESFYTKEFLGTTDTGEASPIWSVRFMEKEAPAHLEVIEGKVERQEKERKTTKHVYNINVETQKARLRENTLYFPGWQVLIDGKPVETEFQDPANRGLLTFWVEKGEHKIEVIFQETKLRVLANFISSVGFLGCLGYLSFLSRKRRRK